MSRCVIFGGADIADYGRIRAALREDDYLVCCDSGLKHAERLGLTPSLIVGDLIPTSGRTRRLKRLCCRGKRTTPTWFSR